MRSLLLFYCMLILLLQVWSYAEPIPNHNAYWLNGLLMALPLLLCAATLWRPARDGIVMLALVTLLYFVHACLGLYDPSGSRWWPATEMLLVLVLFYRALLIARALNSAERRKEQQQEQKQS